MEQLTRDEIEMCQIAVSHVAEYKLNNNKEKWNTLWDKLERMQRDCLTKRVPDAANVCRVINHFYVEGVCSQCGSKEPPRG
jgi:hypothetical protein